MKILEKFAKTLASSKEPEGPAQPPAPWYEAPGSPDRATWWWAVEHLGHPAFYLRALMPGDFAPGRAPLARHVADLDGDRWREGVPVVCGTCSLAPEAEDLEPIERCTGLRGVFLREYRDRRARWPRATDPGSCWLCSTPRQRAARAVRLDGVGDVRTCERCAPRIPHLAARRQPSR